MPYESKAQAAYMHIHHPDIAADWKAKGHGYVKSKKVHGKLRKVEKVEKSKKDWAIGLGTATIGGAAANQVPRVQDLEREHKRRKKGKVAKAYAQHVHSDDPEFNHIAAKKTFDLVMKMDDDEAEMFALIAISEIFENDISKNLRTLQGHLNEVLSKRLEAIGGALDRVIAKGDSPEALAYGTALQEITKAVVNPYIAGLYDFKESDFRRDPHSGQFRAKIKTTQKKPFPNAVADGMNLRPTEKKDRARYSSLKPEERAAYQDQYRQLQAFLNVAAQSGTGDQRIKLRWEDKNGNEFRTDHTGLDPAAANNLLLRRGTNLIGAEANPEGLQVGGAGFALAQAMGAQPGPRTGTYLEGVNVGADQLNDFGQNWLRANEHPERATNQALYNRTHAAGQYLGAVAPNNSKTQAAARLAEIVGSHGAEAEAVIGPTARKTAYRYRGTEKKPDPHIVDAYNRAIRTAKLSGPGASNIELEAEEKRLAVRSRGGGKAPVETASRQATRIKGVGGGGEVAPSVGQMGAARATAEAALREARPPTWQERSEGRKAIVEQLKTDAHMPNQKLYELQTKAGNTPPSEGVLINAKGQIAAQAVGYGDDHYLPFNLKNLKALKGGEYIRTRSVGGLTSEDIYTGLMSGARRVTVVSRSGTFTVEFEPDFRGGRRYNDKALRMTRRYEQLLDAVQSKQVSRGNVPVEVQDALRAQVLEDYPYEQSRAALKSKYEQRLKEYRSDPELGPQDEKMIRFIQNRVAEQNPSRSESEWLRAAKNKVQEGKRVNYQLDAQGYEAAQDALEEQFPYYIKSRPVIEEEPEKISYENDKGYVEPGRVLATALSGGLYGTVENEGENKGEKQGERKYSQSQANYQRGRIGPGKRDLSPEPRPGTIRRVYPGAPAAAPAVAPAETEGPAVIETEGAEEPEAAPGAVAAAGFGLPAPPPPAATPPAADPAAAAPAVARMGRPAQPVVRQAPAPAAPAAEEPADPAAAAGPDTPGTAAQSRVDRVRNEQRHEDAAYELFQDLKVKVVPGAAVRTSHADIMGMDEEQFLEAWQANSNGFRDRFSGMVTQLEGETEAVRTDPKVLAYRRARNQAVNRVVAGPALVQHWQREPQHFIGLGYQPNDTNEQRNAAVEVVDRKTRPVTATSALSELADVDGGLEREHQILRRMHGELKADPTLSNPEKIDERNQALTRIFDGGQPTDAASRLITTASTNDLISRMGDVQRMRTIRSQYQGVWPFKAGDKAVTGTPTELQRRPDGRPRLTLVGQPEPERSAQTQALDRHTNKNKVLNRVKALRRYRAGLEIDGPETPGDDSLHSAEAMLKRFEPGRTPPSDDEVSAFLDATDADYKTNPEALDELKPGEVQLLMQDPDMFLSQFEMNDDGHWVRQQSETG